MECEKPISDFYEHLHRADAYEELRIKEDEILKKGLLFYVFTELKNLLRNPTVDRVIDVGSGNATNLVLLKRYISAGEYIAVDICEPKQKISNIKYIRTTAENLVNILPKDSVSLFLMIEVIEHLFDPDTTIQGIRELLKPGGFLLITTPNLSSIVNRLLLLLGYMPIGPDVSTKHIFGRPTVGGGVPGHIRVHTFRSLQEFLQYYGFTILKSYTLPARIEITGNFKMRLVIRAINLIERISTLSKWKYGSRILLVARK